MPPTLLSSQRGISLLELAVVGGISLALSLVAGSAIVRFTKWQIRVQARLDRMVDAQLAVSNMTKFGSLADTCSKLPSGTVGLECTVQFIEGSPEVIRFVMEPVSVSDPSLVLKYLRDGKLMWARPAKEFTVCNSAEVEAGCLGNPVGVPLTNYFRFKVVFLLSDEEGFSSQSAFFLRNTVLTDGVKYMVKGF